MLLLPNQQIKNTKKCENFGFYKSFLKIGKLPQYLILFIIRVSHSKFKDTYYVVYYPYLAIHINVYL